MTCGIAIAENGREGKGRGGDGKGVVDFVAVA
jgi:hypothetical protein